MPTTPTQAPRPPRSPGARPRRPHAAIGYRRPASLRLIRAGLFTLIGVALFALLYTAAWYVGARTLRARVVDWVQSRPAAGLEAGYDKIEIAGFPTLFRVIVTNPRLARPDPAPGWRWQGSRAVAEVRPWQPGRLRLDFAGRQEVEWGPAGAQKKLEGSAGLLAVEGALHEDGLPKLAVVEAAKVQLDAGRPGGGVSVGRLAVRAERKFPSAPDHRTPTFVLHAEARELAVPDSVPLPLGHRLAALSLDARVLGKLSFAAFLEGLSSWRDDGGTVEITSLNARYGPLAVTASGTLAIDRDLQPIGALTARFEGFFSAIEKLRQAGLIERRDAAMAKLVLGALAHRPEDGGPASLSVPLSIQNRSLYVGPVKIWKVPLVDWAGGTVPGAGLQILR